MKSEPNYAEQTKMHDKMQKEQVVLAQLFTIA